MELFEELTVRATSEVVEDTHSALAFVRVSASRSSAAVALRRVGHRRPEPARGAHRRPDALPHGVIKLVGIARTIIANLASDVDEPAAGLDDGERRVLAALIGQMAERHGIAVVVVEHDMALILNTCDRIVVLDFG